MHYAVVLLLSLQFRRALNFLHVHSMCRGLRVVAPALSLVVHAHSLTTLGGAGDLCGAAAGHAGLVNRIPATVCATCKAVVSVSHSCCGCIATSACMHVCSSLDSLFRPVGSLLEHYVCGEVEHCLDLFQGVVLLKSAPGRHCSAAVAM